MYRYDNNVVLPQHLQNLVNAGQLTYDGAIVLMNSDGVGAGNNTANTVNDSDVTLLVEAGTSLAVAKSNILPLIYGIANIKIGFNNRTIPAHEGDIKQTEYSQLLAKLKEYGALYNDNVNKIILEIIENTVTPGSVAFSRNPAPNRKPYSGSDNLGGLLKETNPKYMSNTNTTVQQPPVATPKQSDIGVSRGITKHYDELDDDDTNVVTTKRGEDVPVQKQVEKECLMLPGHELQPMTNILTVAKLVNDEASGKCHYDIVPLQQEVLTNKYGKAGEELYVDYLEHQKLYEEFVTKASRDESKKLTLKYVALEPVVRNDISDIINEGLNYMSNSPTTDKDSVLIYKGVRNNELPIEYPNANMDSSTVKDYFKELFVDGDSKLHNFVYKLNELMNNEEKPLLAKAAAKIDMILTAMLFDQVKWSSMIKGIEFDSTLVTGEYDSIMEFIETNKNLELVNKFTTVLANLESYIGEVFKYNDKCNISTSTIEFSRKEVGIAVFPVLTTVAVVNNPIIDFELNLPSDTTHAYVKRENVEVLHTVIDKAMRGTNRNNVLLLAGNSYWIVYHNNDRPEFPYIIERA